MDLDGSITENLQRLALGDADAAALIFRRCIDRLLGHCRAKLRGGKTASFDEEDLAQQVLENFFRGVEEGKYARLSDRDDLWQVLFMLAERRSIDQIRKQNAAKHGAGKVRGESVFQTRDGEEIAGLDGIANAEPRPEMVVAMNETIQQQLAELDEKLREVALLKLAGYSNQEVRERLKERVAIRTVERRLERIRELWGVPENDQ